MPTPLHGIVVCSEHASRWWLFALSESVAPNEGRCSGFQFSETDAAPNVWELVNATIGRRGKNSVSPPFLEGAHISLWKKTCSCFRKVPLLTSGLAGEMDGGRRETDRARRRRPVVRPLQAKFFYLSSFLSSLSLSLLSLSLSLSPAHFFIFCLSRIFPALSFFFLPPQAKNRGKGGRNWLVC